MKKVAVHAHMHYIDLMERVAGYLRHIPLSFDLFVTITDSSAESIVRENVRAWVPRASVTVLPVTNKGRDIKPFYTDVAPRLAGYDVIGHIHGKKSVFNNGATEGWLEHLLDSLMGSEETVRTIFRQFEQDEKTGLIYPARYPRMPYWANTWLSNRGWAVKLRDRLHLTSVPETYFNYPVGNMFWARVAAIRPLLELGLQDHDYPPEAGQNDGEIMHALERMTTVVSRAHGFTNYVVRPAPEGITLADDKDGVDLSGYHGNSLDHLRQAIDRSQTRVVSFDIFDTLVVRAVPDPTDIFRLMQPAVNRVTGCQVDFPSIRSEADQWSRMRLAPGKDVNLEDIYDRISEVLALTREGRDELLALELALESRFIRSRRTVVEVLNYACDHGKRVVLTSDIYLQKDFITGLLHQLGIERYHHIYLSSDIGKRKDARTMFPHILRAEGVRPEEMIHVGDNEHADLQVPGDLGILTFHVMKPVELFRCTPFGKTGFPGDREQPSVFARLSLGLMLAKVFDEPFPRSDSPVNGNLHHFGYWYFGPVLLAYVKWIMDRAKTDNISTLYFLARDGDILIRIYRLLQEYVDYEVPNSIYLEVSRRSVGVPFVQRREQLDKLLQPDYPGGRLRDLVLVRLGIDLADHPEVDVQAYGFGSMEANVCLPADLPKVKLLSYRLLETCRTHFAKEQEYSLGYLRDMGFFDKGSKAVVDIGYSGTLQRILNDVSSGEPIHGYYMVLYKTFDALVNNPGIRAQGLFGDRIDPRAKELSIDRYSLFYEMILSSVRGPVSSYVREPDGRHRPIYAPVSPKEKYKLLKLPIIHEGILDYCRDVLELLDATAKAVGCRISVPASETNLLLAPFQSFLENPCLADMEMLAGYSLDDEYCGQGILYWAPPPREETKDSSAPRGIPEGDFLWKKYVPFAPLWSGGARPGAREGYGGFANRREYEIFKWYEEQYETLPGWFKKIGQLFKILRGTKRIRIVLEDVGYVVNRASKADEIQSWYNKEYEVLPRWYKRFGQFLRILLGRRGWTNKNDQSTPA